MFIGEIALFDLIPMSTIANLPGVFQSVSQGESLFIGEIALFDLNPMPTIADLTPPFWEFPRFLRVVSFA